MERFPAIRVFHVDFNYISRLDGNLFFCASTSLRLHHEMKQKKKNGKSCSFLRVCRRRRNRKFSSCSAKGVRFDWRKKDTNYQVRSAFSHFFREPFTGCAWFGVVDQKKKGFLLFLIITQKKLIKMTSKLAGNSPRIRAIWGLYLREVSSFSLW